MTSHTRAVFTHVAAERITNDEIVRTQQLAASTYDRARQLIELGPVAYPVAVMCQEHAAAFSYVARRLMGLEPETTDDNEDEAIRWIAFALGAFASKPDITPDALRIRLKLELLNDAVCAAVIRKAGTLLADEVRRPLAEVSLTNMMCMRSLRYVARQIVASRCLRVQR